jgi:transcriptional regulator with XRE-family HTH domain
MAEHTSYSHLKGEMVMTPEKAFGKVLREIRNEHSLSQEELGFESGYHRTYISLLERGKKSLLRNTIFRSLMTARVHPQDSRPYDYKCAKSHACCWRFLQTGQEDNIRKQHYDCYQPTDEIVKRHFFKKVREEFENEKDPLSTGS